VEYHANGGGGGLFVRHPNSDADYDPNPALKPNHNRNTNRKLQWGVNSTDNSKQWQCNLRTLVQFHSKKSTQYTAIDRKTNTA